MSAAGTRLGWLAREEHDQYGDVWYSEPRHVVGIDSDGSETAARVVIEEYAYPGDPDSDQPPAVILYLGDAPSQMAYTMTAPVALELANALVEYASLIATTTQED